jgi:pimeloyl-ACP methyl ester carboxylesterase
LYRNIDRNIETQADLAGRPLTQPSLLVTVDKDPVLPAEMADGMPQYASDLEITHLTDCGHWTQQEQPDRLIELLLDWMGRQLPA